MQSILATNDMPSRGRHPQVRPWTPTLQPLRGTHWLARSPWVLCRSRTLERRRVRLPPWLRSTGNICRSWQVFPTVFQRTTALPSDKPQLLQSSPFAEQIMPPTSLLTPRARGLVTGNRLPIQFHLIRRAAPTSRRPPSQVGGSLLRSYCFEAHNLNLRALLASQGPNMQGTTTR